MAVYSHDAICIFPNALPIPGLIMAVHGSDAISLNKSHLKDNLMSVFSQGTCHFSCLTMIFQHENIFSKNTTLSIIIIYGL